MFARIKFSIGSTLRQNKLKEKVEKIRGGVINVKKGGKRPNEERKLELIYNKEKTFTLYVVAWFGFPCGSSLSLDFQFNFNNYYPLCVSKYK